MNVNEFCLHGLPLSAPCTDCTQLARDMGIADDDLRAVQTDTPAKGQPSSKTLDLPTWNECADLVQGGVASALERFIYEHEPAGGSDEMFRNGLAAALSEAGTSAVSAEPRSSEPPSADLVAVAKECRANGYHDWANRIERATVTKSDTPAYGPRGGPLIGQLKQIADTLNARHPELLKEIFTPKV